VATAIAIGNPASGPSALTAAEHSGGSIRAVTDSEILDAYHLLAAREGIFVEPASAASVAGLLRYGVPAGSVVVATLTGNGLKDPDVATKDMAPLESIDADPTALRRLLGI
jgi:threonine synthase